MMFYMETGNTAETRRSQLRQEFIGILKTPKDSITRQRLLSAWDNYLEMKAIYYQENGLNADLSLQELKKRLSGEKHKESEALVAASYLLFDTSTPDALQKGGLLEGLDSSDLKNPRFFLDRMQSVARDPRKLSSFPTE